MRTMRLFRLTLDSWIFSNAVYHLGFCFWKTQIGNFALIWPHLFGLQDGFTNSTALSGCCAAHREKSEHRTTYT